MKNILFAVLLFPSIAFAGLSITDGNVKQESCDFPEAIKARSWRIDPLPPPDVSLKNKLIPVGKVISPGDALFYANIAIKRVSYYFADSNVEVVGNGMLTSDIAIPKGTQLYTRGIIRGEGLGKGYLLVGKEDTPNWRSYVAIKDDGFLCSVIVSIDKRDNALLVQDATAYQKSPLVKHEEMVALETIALTLNRLDEVSAAIGIKLIRDGQIVKQKEIQMDAMPGSFNIAGLQILFEREGKSSIKINSINEPDDYLAWRQNIKYTLDH